MSTLTTADRPLAADRASSGVDLAAAAEKSALTSLGDISCWRLLTAQVPLTLLLDLASPADELDAVHDEMLAEPTSLEWVPARTR
jgi:hypothetical protein